MNRFPLPRRAIAVALGAALALAACGADETPAPVTDPEPPPTTMAPPDDPDDTGTVDTDALIADLDGREFVSTAIEGFQGGDEIADVPVRISFDGASLSMNAGCNTMFGGFGFTEGRLTVDALASTEMACDPTLMARDRWLADVVSLGANVDLDGDVLVLSGVAGSRIEFLDRVVAEPDLPLEDVRWVLDGIRDHDAVSSIPEGVIASITFTEGRALVEAGCNRGSAEVEIGPDTITFSPLGLTKMMCEPAAMEVEAAITAVLDGQVSYTITSDRLTIDTIEPDATTDDEFPEMGGRGLMFVADPAELDDA